MKKTLCMSKKNHRIYQRIAFLIISAIVLFLAINFEYYSEKTNWSKSVECRILPFYEHIDFRKSNQSSFSSEISILTTPFSKTTYLQIGDTASYAKYVPLFGKIYVREYSVGNDGTRYLTDSKTVDREDTYSDYYSPLLHKNGGASTFGVFSHFGTYSIK